MQKAFVAIIVALALSSAVAQTINANGWAKTPVSVCEDTNYNCTNRSALTLNGLSNSDVNIFSYNGATVSNDTKNASDASWDLWTKVIDTKALASTQNTSYSFKAAQRAAYISGYAIGREVANDTNGVKQIFLYQTKLGGSAVLPRVQMTSNKDANFTPTPAGEAVNFKTGTIFYFYNAAGNKVNYTTLVLGASAVGKEFTLATSSYNATTSQFGIVWGEALGSSQVYAGWTEGDAFKVAVVDCSAGSVAGAADLGAYNKNYTCSPYSTDKKYYGIYCTNPVNATTTEVYMSANSTSLLKLFTIANTTTQRITNYYPYAGYYAFFYTDSSNAGATVLSTEIWDVEKFVVFRNKTDYLTFNASTVAMQSYRVPQGGVYTLIWNKPANASDPNSTKTKVQAGLVLEGSYLTTIFGALMTIIAGLLLF